MTDGEFRYLIETHRISVGPAGRDWEARVLVEESPRMIRHEVAVRRSPVAAVEALARSMGWLAAPVLPLFQTTLEESNDAL